MTGPVVAMRRIILCAVLALSACWRGQAAAPPPVEPAAPPLAASLWVPPGPDDPCEDMTYDPGNQVCSTACPSGAAYSSNGCRRLHSQLVARGFSCGTHPRSCLLSAPPSPGSPPPLKARITARIARDGDTVLTIGAGSSQGVTSQWHATLVDTTGAVGAIRVTKVDRNRTTGIVPLRPLMIGPDAFVILAP